MTNKHRDKIMLCRKKRIYAKRITSKVNKLNFYLESEEKIDYSVIQGWLSEINLVDAYIH